MISEILIKDKGLHALGRTDVWPELRKGDPGHTYDGPGNRTLSNWFSTQLDKVGIELSDQEPESTKAPHTRVPPQKTIFEASEI